MALSPFDKFALFLGRSSNDNQSLCEVDEIPPMYGNVLVKQDICDEKHLVYGMLLDHCISDPQIRTEVLENTKTITRRSKSNETKLSYLSALHENNFPVKKDYQMYVSHVERDEEMATKTNESQHIEITENKTHEIDETNMIYGTALFDATDEDFEVNIVKRNKMYIPKIERDMQSATNFRGNSRIIRTNPNPQVKWNNESNFKNRESLPVFIKGLIEYIPKREETKIKNNTQNETVNPLITKIYGATDETN